MGMHKPQKLCVKFCGSVSMNLTGENVLLARIPQQADAKIILNI